MTTFTINSEESLQRTLGELRSLWNQHKYLRLNVKTGKDRSLNYNDLSHVWYEILARELPQDNALGHKAFCKLNFAVPIMRAEDAEFRAFYDSSIRKSLSYEQKILAMRYFPVSSLMTNAQFKQYCEAMQAHFRTQGVLLEFPKEEKQ